MEPNIDEQDTTDEQATQDVQLRIAHDGYTFDFERMLREQRAREARIDQMGQDWLLLTGESMDQKDLKRLHRDWGTIYGSRISPNNFERLKYSWSLLTRSLDPAGLDQIVQSMTVEDLKNMKQDYLVLNWMTMSSTDFELLKENWLKIAGSRGVDSGEKVIKRWLLRHAPHMEYRHMRQEEIVEYTRTCLERGAAVFYDGSSLLHSMLSMMHAPLIEVLLSFGADATLRCSWSKETPLESIRSYYYKDHEDIVSLLQTAEKSARKNASSKSDATIKVTFNNDLLDSSPEAKRNSVFEVDQLDKKMVSVRLDNKAEKWWIESSEPPFLSRLCELFDIVELKDIGTLMIRVINYMYVSRVIKTELKYKMHQVFSMMCTKLFNLFDPHFDRPVNVSFGRDTVLSESAELVFLLEIDPEVEWVALKLYAVPWDIEYYVYCKTSSISRFSLGSTLRNSFSICSSNLLCDYEPYLGEYQARLVNM